MTNNINACDDLNTIRPSSSSLNRAPSWSLGVGADNDDSDNPDRNNRTLTNGTQLITGTEDSTSNNRLTSGSSEFSNCPKLTIQIPTAYLTKKDVSSSSSSYHVYQITIMTSTGEKWSVYRRYSQFYELHQQLKTKDPTVGKFIFPPKKRLNSKASTIVQDRRRKLEEYVTTLNCYIEKLPPSPYESGSIHQLHDLISCNSLAESRARSLCETNSLSDSANSEPAYSGDHVEQVERINTLLPTSSSRSAYNSDPNEHYSLTNKESVRSLFHRFISFQDKRDEHFDPTNIGG